MTASALSTTSTRLAERLAIGRALPAWPARRLVQGVGALLAAALLLAYCVALSASARQAAGRRQAEVSLRQERIACEKLPRAGARSACNARVALRGVGDEPVAQP